MKHFRAQLEALLKIFTSKFRKFSNYSDRRVRRQEPIEFYKINA